MCIPHNAQNVPIVPSEALMHSQLFPERPDRSPSFPQHALMHFEEGQLALMAPYGEQNAKL